MLRLLSLRKVLYQLIESVETSLRFDLGIHLELDLTYFTGISHHPQPAMDLTPVLVETWTLYAIGSTMIGARVFVRTRLVGVQGYGPDDYLVWFTWVR